MIITLEEAQKIKPSITQAELDAFEQTVRSLTNNNFQITKARIYGLFILGNTLNGHGVVNWLKVGDTLQISRTDINDGLYTITEIDGAAITLDQELVDGEFSDGYATLVRYPADIKAGVMKLIEYDERMADKLGIKSESVSRMSVTYYDATAGETKDGYPSSLMGFLRKYEKMRWG